ncbi:uncharacterized protein LOC123548442 isoform X2 [Mercenaria mercenaria]|nr:uncharacterized protein LOC123548442 isoform X2 [Mercenaria mercenaria]
MPVSKEAQPEVKISSEYELCVKTPQESKACYITGMVLLSPSKLILADNRNSSIKMVDLNNSSIADRLPLDTQPWDITLVTGDLLAVTLPNKASVQFMSVSSNKLSLGETLKVDGRCHGISYFQEKLVLTRSYPGKQCLQFIDLKGMVLKKYIKISDSEMPCNVTSNNHYIYVSDAEGAVLRLDGEGEQIGGKYDGLNQPRSLATLEDEESILVCEYGNGKIQNISCDLTRASAWLEGLTSPWGICWCGTSRKLYVSYAKNDETYDNVVHIYKKL